MKKNLNLANKIWEIIFPVAMYYVTIVIVMFCAQLIFGTGNETYMICKTIGSLATLVVVWSYYRQDLALAGKLGRKFTVSKDVFVYVLWTFGIAVCVSVGLNNIISMSPIMQMSDSYGDAADAFYGSSIWLELLGAAVVTPVLEEMLHRGVVYKRLRNMTGIWRSVILSALIFAGLHFNLVQFIYAFLLGIVFALLMEKTDRLIYPVFAHIIANTIAVIRTETGFWAQTVDGSVSAWAISIGVLVIGVIGTVVLYKGDSRKE